MVRLKRPDSACRWLGRAKKVISNVEWVTLAKKLVGLDVEAVPVRDEQ